MTNRKHEMVLNAALFVEKPQVSRLAEEVRALREVYAPYGFEFEMVGPFPPYNFIPPLVASPPQSGSPVPDGTGGQPPAGATGGGISQLPACAERSEADRPEGIIHE